MQNAVWQTYGGYVTIKGERTDLKGGYTTGDYRLRYYLLNGEPFFREEHNDDPAELTSPIGTQLPVQRFRIAPGEVVRFRMLNGNSDNLMPIVVDGHAVHLIGMDGINYPSLRTMPAEKESDGAAQLLLASETAPNSSSRAVRRPASTASASSPTTSSSSKATRRSSPRSRSSVRRWTWRCRRPCRFRCANTR